MHSIDYYMTAISPYTYLADDRLEQIAARHGAGIVYRPVDAIALFSRTGGVPPAARHPARQSYRAEDLQRQAANRNMPFNLAPAHWPTNAAPSGYAIIAAQAAGGGDVGRLVRDLCRACWAEDRDVADDSVIRECLSAAGFDPELADSGLLAGAETYGANLDRAVAAGVFGLPFYITGDGAKFWGQDRLDDLDRHLTGAGA
ncbi:MAG: 2-hydroxychromene-2-carboxylate isomerase [Rhodobacteraceae bacterium]|nr:2-hydroxychromene-2-carboxylate isomerase [Paracoccaceae bacterium]